MKDSAKLFSDRVQDYLAHRPGYSTALLALLRAACNFSDEAVIADIGSGTGLLSELFLINGNLVYGVEPNTEMRSAGETKLKAYLRFISVAARAEATRLNDHSVDFITAGQAYHWFELEKSKKEFTRILKPKGWVVVVYNCARVDTPFLAAYQQLGVTYLGDKVTTQEEADLYSPLFGEGDFTEKRIDGLCQSFDFKGLSGIVRSKANVPEENSTRYSEMMDSLVSIFEQHQRDGKVMISYDTQVVYGQLLKQ